jgi:DNA-binding HxlR family transcriptional regulator
MIMELLRHKDYLRIMMALERKPLRFSEIQKNLGLNPTQVDRALTFLRKGFWIIPKTLPAEKGPIRLEYGLGKRGAAFLTSFASFRDQAELHESELGKSEVAELWSLNESVPSVAAQLD